MKKKWMKKEIKILKENVRRLQEEIEEYRQSNIELHTEIKTFNQGITLSEEIDTLYKLMIKYKNQGLDSEYYYIERLFDNAMDRLQDKENR